MNQQQLTLPAIVPVPKSEAPLTIQQRFELFHKLNPHIYVRLVEMARRLKAQGHEKFGIKMLWEQIRWSYFETTIDNTGYALNNIYTAHYARLIQSTETDLKNVFETRKLLSP